MTSWRDFARKLEPDGIDRAISANSAKSPVDGLETAPNGTNGTNGTTSLPPDVTAGLARLAGMACPRDVDPAAWSETVRDAVVLAEEGWAYQALSLGWSPLDLFGAVTGRDDDPHADGLAVWLSGRKLRALSAIAATAVDAAGARHCFNRPRATGARLLWELGGGR